MTILVCPGFVKRRQSAHEVAKVVGERVKLEADWRHAVAPDRSTPARPLPALDKAGSRPVNLAGTRSPLEAGKERLPVTVAENRSLLPVSLAANPAGIAAGRSGAP